MIIHAIVKNTYIIQNKFLNNNDNIKFSQFAFNADKTMFL